MAMQKKIEISQCGYRSNTEEVTWNTYHYGYEKFERPIKKAYRVSIHHSYGVGGNEYDMCYDVFGNITDQEHLDKIKAEYEQRKEYEERSRSYQKNFYSNYSKYFEGGGSSYHNSISDNYMEEDREILKRFYRSLTKQFHPDASPDADTSKEMQLLNRLKSEWGV